MGDQIPEHESAVRRMMADSKGAEYVAYRSLAEAKADPDGAVILEGDYGGQIYLTAPAAAVECTEESLATLLHDLDEIAWDVNEGQGASIVYERKRRNQGVGGGMGGGVVIDRPWVHGEFRTLGLEGPIAEVLAGREARIPHLTRRQLAERYWRGGRARDVGPLIVPDLEPSQRPPWAADVLEFMVGFSPAPNASADQLIRIARDPDLWPSIPVLLQGLEDEAKKSGAPAREGVQWLLIDVASVIADAGGYQNPSGRAAGWLIPAELHRFAYELADSVLADAWEVLVHRWSPSDESPT